MKQAFKAIGLTDQQIEEIYRILAAILLFGELQLQQVEGEEECEIKNAQRLEDIEFLFKIQPFAAGVGLATSLTTKFLKLVCVPRPAIRSRLGHGALTCNGDKF